MQQHQHLTYTTKSACTCSPGEVWDDHSVTLLALTLSYSVQLAGVNLQPADVTVTGLYYTAFNPYGGGQVSCPAPCAAVRLCGWSCCER